MEHLKDRSCSARRSKCLRKHDKVNMGKHPTHPLKVVCRHRLPEFITEHNIGAKKKCFSIASLLKDMTIRLRKVNGLQNAKHWNLRLNADGPQKPL